MAAIMAVDCKTGGESESEANQKPCVRLCGSVVPDSRITENGLCEIAVARD